MRSAEPFRAGEFADNALIDAVVGGVFIPVLQYFFLTFFDALPDPKLAGSISLVFIIVIVGTNLLPVMSTLVTMAAAFGIGGRVGVALYVIMSVATSAVLENPVMGITVLLVATLAMALWLFVQARGQNQTAGRGLR